MAYTVKQLAKVSGVSVRTLHFYDEMGLLKPAYHGANGYRYYEEQQLLALQQILFFRELGFELKAIKKILGRGDFDKISALSAHRRVLEQKLARTHTLIETIDKTINHLKGKEKMADSDMYQGFNKENIAEYEKYLVNRFGDKVKDLVAESRENMKRWSKEDLEQRQQEWDAICKELSDLHSKQYSADSKEVQIVVHRHYVWLKAFWTPDRESYIGQGQGYTGFEWKKTFEPYDREHPKLAQFLADGIKVFAMRELT